MFTPMADAAGPSVSRELLSHAGDYTCMWWPYGWRGRSPEGHRVFCVQTNQYGLAFDLDRASLTHLGLIEKPLPEAQAIAEPNDAVFRLPKVRLSAVLEVAGRTYSAVAVASKRDAPRILDHGRYFVRMELLDVRFVDDAGKALADLHARYEFVCWPDRVAVLLHIKPEESLRQPRLSMSLQFDDRSIAVVDAAPQARLVRSPGEASGGFAVLRPGRARWFDEAAPGRGGTVGVQTPEAVGWRGNRPRTFALIVVPIRPAEEAAIAERVRDELGPQAADTVTACGIEPYRHPLEVAYDEMRGCYRVRLGHHDSDDWWPGEDPNRLERVALALRNPRNSSRTLRLLLAKQEKFEGVVGMSPMIRDGDGFPTGLPVQISKNWHESTWFDGATILQMPPARTADMEFTLAYAQWGGVPAVSHAQLCLVGWGENQLWHQVAIGAYGEAICYDPDVCLQRSMIDDMRPLLVRAMKEKDWSAERCGWTNNVGGGDFLVLFNPKGERQYLARMKTAYTRYGPNLAEVAYAGTTPDDGADVRIVLRHYRSDDITRGLYHVRYDVRKGVTFGRLAFFQLGADLYNDHQFRKLARGNVDGSVEEWTPNVDGRGYEREGLVCEGKVPWFSLHEAVPDPKSPGAWANRGLIIRSWKARLGGRDVPVPIAGVHRTKDKVPSVLVELTPPPGVTRLEPGDFVEADLELIVLPMSAADYYGPNAALRDALKANANTWRMVQREAVGNNLAVSASVGTVESAYPVRVRCDADGNASFTVSGGIGYVPLTIAGLRDYRRCVLEHRTPAGWVAVDQSVHGHDFWQTDYDAQSGLWDLTLNVCLDRTEPTPQGQAFRLRL
jgi:hypothetical protein